MAKRQRPKYKQGFFTPKFPHKYVGDATQIVFRSGLEKRFMKFFDENTNILQWASEEIVVPYIGPDKQEHRYFPDFIVKMKDKNNKVQMYMVEIKPESQTIAPVKGRKRQSTFLAEMLTWSVNDAKWKAARIWCEQRGMKFVILTEKDIMI